MKLETFDLNLLRALELLLTECSVTRAAERMHVTQSAMSGILRRLREQFGDPLLVASGRTMRPTPRGLELLTPVRHTLQFIRSEVLDYPGFEPGSSDRHFTVASTDFTTFAILMEAVRRIASLAPSLRLTIVRPVIPTDIQLERGEADVVLLHERSLDRSKPCRFLFEDDFRVIAWDGNSRLPQNLTKRIFFELEHIAVTPDDGFLPLAERWLQTAHGGRRKLRAVVPSYLEVPYAIVGTDRIAVVHARFARDFVERFPLVARPVPLPLPATRIWAQWHPVNETDAGLQWLVGLLTQVAREAS
jgi:DNA-binding transcriptional LysR family regulator